MYRIELGTPKVPQCDKLCVAHISSVEIETVADWNMHAVELKDPVNVLTNERVQRALLPLPRVSAPHLPRLFFNL